MDILFLTPSHIFSSVLVQAHHRKVLLVQAHILAHLLGRTLEARDRERTVESVVRFLDETQQELQEQVRQE
jgi:hypothetical protein